MPRRVRTPRKRFHGTLEQLDAVLVLAGRMGSWELMPAGYRRFVCRNGAILNWWPSTGTINFQGRPAARADLEQAIAKAVSGLLSADQRLLERHNPPDRGEQG